MKVKHTNLILGSTEWRNVVGSETYWQMGLAVAPEISLRNFSAPKALVGKTLTHHGVWGVSLAEALIWVFNLNLGVNCIRVLFSERRWVTFGGIRVLGLLGLSGKEGNVTVVMMVRCVKFIGWEWWRCEWEWEKRRGLWLGEVFVTLH